MVTGEQNFILVTGKGPLNLRTGDRQLFFPQFLFFRTWIELPKCHIIGGTINNIHVD